VAGGADWSLIDLIAHWPNKDDQFILYVNKSHEGLNLLKEKMPSTVEVKLFSTLLEVRDKYTQPAVFSNRLIKKIVLLFLIPLYYFIYKREVAGVKYDALMMNNGGYPGGLTNFLISLAAKSLKIKKRVMIVRNYPAYYSSANMLMKLSDWACNRSLTHLITVSNSLKNAIINKTNINTDIIDYIYNGVSVNNKISNASDYREINYVKNLSVGIIGTIQERKGHKVLLRSWVAVLKEFPEAKLYIVASSSSGDKAELVEICNKLLIAHSIVWVEFTKNIGDIYRNLNVVVMPSLEYESFGRIIVEAMAFSVPIIATKVGGMPELIDHGIDGYLVEKNDEGELSKYIIKLLNDPVEAKKIGKVGYQKYIKHYTADVMAENYYTLFNKTDSTV